MKKWQKIMLIEQRLHIYFIDCHNNVSVNMAVVCADNPVALSLVWHPVVAYAMSQSLMIQQLNKETLLVPIYYSILDLPASIPPTILSSAATASRVPRDVRVAKSSAQRQQLEHEPSSKQLSYDDETPQRYVPESDSLFGVKITAEGSLLSAILDLSESNLQAVSEQQDDRPAIATAHETSTTDKQIADIAATASHTGIGEVDISYPDCSLFGILTENRDENSTTAEQNIAPLTTTASLEVVKSEKKNTSCLKNKKRKRVAWQDEEQSKSLVSSHVLHASSSQPSSSSSSSNQMPGRRIFEHIEKIHDEDSKSSLSHEGTSPVAPAIALEPLPLPMATSSSASTAASRSSESPIKRKGAPSLSVITSSIAPAILIRNDSKPHLRRITPTLLAPLSLRDKYLAWMHTSFQ
jgi:hypothetical protein